MQFTRREFAATGLAFFAGLALPGASPLAMARRRQDEPDAKGATYFDWIEVAPGAWMASKGGGNALLVRSVDECILVDAKNCGLGDTLRREALALGGALTVVVNTHHHGDHIGGNPSFKKDLPVLAHQLSIPRVVANMERTLSGLARFAKQVESGAESMDPQVAAEIKAIADRAGELTPRDFTSTVPLSDMHQFAVRKLSVHMTHPGPGHTDNDMFVYFPDMNLLHTGDLLFNKLHPYMDAPAGATSRGWQKSIDAMLKLCNDKTIVVAGHGDVTDCDGLKAQSAYFDTIRDIVSEARKQPGATRESITQLKPSAFDGLGFEQIRANNLGVLFDELEAEDAK